jgi:hypothetical protein
VQVVLHLSKLELDAVVVLPPLPALSLDRPLQLVIFLLSLLEILPTAQSLGDLQQVYNAIFQFIWNEGQDSSQGLFLNNQLIPDSLDFNLTLLLVIVHLLLEDDVFVVEVNALIDDIGDVGMDLVDVFFDLKGGQTLTFSGFVLSQTTAL